MAKIDQYLSIAIQSKASDLHFSSGEPTRMRVDGDLVNFNEGPKSDTVLKDLLFEILTDDEKQKLLTVKNLDKSYAVPGIGFFRVNCFWTRKGIGAVLRTIPQKIPTIADLSLPEVCQTLAESSQGLVLVTGPTGSGKSTTLASMINHINSNYPYHILTAEDPVEFVHESKKSLINQREIGASCPTFADALKYALREDPDVILVGELRDLETISLALTAAATGHLVFGTLHTRGAAPSIDRVIDSFPANQQPMIRTMLSESLVGVISQVLLKRCDKPGRVAAHEILVVNHAVGNLIREGKTFQIPSIMQTGRKEGMVLMDQSIIDLVNQKKVAVEEGIPYMENPAPLRSRVSKKTAPPKATALPTKPAGAIPKTPVAKPPIPVATPTPPPVVAAPVAEVVVEKTVAPEPVAPPTPQPEPQLEPMNESSIQIDFELSKESPIEDLTMDENILELATDETLSEVAEEDSLVDWESHNSETKEELLSDLTAKEEEKVVQDLTEKLAFKEMPKEAPKEVPREAPKENTLFKNLPPPPPLKKKVA